MDERAADLRIPRTVAQLIVRAPVGFFGGKAVDDAKALSMVASEAKELPLVNVARAHRAGLYSPFPYGNICSVTAQGSAYPHLRRALDVGNVAEALSAASELPYVGLADALELCLLLCREEPERFNRAAVRWHARYCSEVRAELDEAQAVLACLAALRSPRRQAAATALADLIHRRHLGQASEALKRWASKKQTMRT